MSGSGLGLIIRRALLAQPLRQMARLLRFQVEAIANLFDRQMQRVLRRRNFVAGKKSLHLVPQVSFAERSGGLHQLYGVELARRLPHFLPMRLQKIPSKPLPGGVLHHGGDQFGDILAADVGSQGKSESAREQFGIAESGQRVEQNVIFLGRGRLLQTAHDLVIE